MRENGLMVRDARTGDFLVRVKVLAISDLQNNETMFDYCIIATKSYDTEWSAKMMDRHVKPDGAFISIQNGINDYRLAESVEGGASRCIGCVTTVGNGCLKPGEVIRWDTADHAFKFGEHDNTVTSRCLELTALFNLPGAVTGGAEVTENLWGARWSKLATNCFINVVSAARASYLPTYESAPALLLVCKQPTAPIQRFEDGAAAGLTERRKNHTLLRCVSLRMDADGRTEWLQDGAGPHAAQCDSTGDVHGSGVLPGGKGPRRRD